MKSPFIQLKSEKTVNVNPRYIMAYGSTITNWTWIATTAGEGYISQESVAEFEDRLVYRLNLSQGNQS